jgi:hypothetical protein
MLALRLWPFPAGLPLLLAANDEVSRFSCMQFLSVPGVCDYAGSQPGLAFIALAGVAFPFNHLLKPQTEPSCLCHVRSRKRTSYHSGPSPKLALCLCQVRSRKRTSYHSAPSPKLALEVGTPSLRTARVSKRTAQPRSRRKEWRRQLGSSRRPDTVVSPPSPRPLRLAYAGGCSENAGNLARVERADGASAAVHI